MLAQRRAHTHTQTHTHTHTHTYTKDFATQGAHTEHCDTQWRRIVMYMGGVLRCYWGGVLKVFPSLQAQGTENTAIRIGGALQYKLDVYCSTFVRSSGGWGFWRSSAPFQRAVRKDHLTFGAGKLCMSFDLPIQGGYYIFCTCKFPEFGDELSQTNLYAIQHQNADSWIIIIIIIIIIMFRHLSCTYQNMYPPLKKLRNLSKAIMQCNRSVILILSFKELCNVTAIPSNFPDRWRTDAYSSLISFVELM